MLVAVEATETTFCRLLPWTDKRMSLVAPKSQRAHSKPRQRLQLKQRISGMSRTSRSKDMNGRLLSCPCRSAKVLTGLPLPMLHHRTSVCSHIHVPVGALEIGLTDLRHQWVSLVAP